MARPPMSRGLPRHCLSLPSKTNAPFHPVLGAPGARRRHHAECYQQPSSRSKLERPRGRHRPATEAQLTAYDVAHDREGNIYISDTENQRIRKVDKDGIITTIAGSGDKGYSGDGGPATEAALNCPVGIAVDGEGNVFFADHHNNVVRKVDKDGTITTFAGTGWSIFPPARRGRRPKCRSTSPGEARSSTGIRAFCTSPTHSTPESGQFAWMAHE